jgi:hypothetical protein
METLIAALTPIYTVAVSILVPLAVAYLLKLVKDRTGIALEQSDRDALQTAIKNAALVAVDKSGGAKMATVVTDTAIDAGVRYVKEAVPDAVERFRKQGLDDHAIAAKIAPQAQILIDSVPTVIADTTKAVATDAFVRSALGR